MRGSGKLLLCRRLAPLWSQSAFLSALLSSSPSFISPVSAPCLLPLRWLRASFSSARLRPPPPSQPLPEAGSFNSRRARRAAQFGHPATPRAEGAYDEKQQRKEAAKVRGDSKPRTYDTWRPVKSGPSPRRRPPTLLRTKTARAPQDAHSKSTMRAELGDVDREHGSSHSSTRRSTPVTQAADGAQSNRGTHRPSARDSAMGHAPKAEDDDDEGRTVHPRAGSPRRASSADSTDSRQTGPRAEGRPPVRKRTAAGVERAGGRKEGGRAPAASRGVSQSDLPSARDVVGQAGSPSRPTLYEGAIDPRLVRDRRGPPDVEGVDEDDYIVQEDVDDGDFDREQPVPEPSPKRASIKRASSSRTPPHPPSSTTAEPSPASASAPATRVRREPVEAPAAAASKENGPLTGAPLVVDGFSFAIIKPPVVKRSVQQLASALSIPILPEPVTTDFTLRFSADGRSLALRHSGARPLVVRWYSDVAGVEKTPLVRALAWGLPVAAAGEQWSDQPLRGRTVFDATAGKALDAYHAAAAGATVHACERHPALFALLTHTQQRCLSDVGAVKLRPRVQRMQLVHADSVDVLRALLSPTPPFPVPDVVYIDTASAEHGATTSLEHKQRAKVERLVAVPGLKEDGERRTRDERLREAEREELVLLDLARRVARHHVVVKRLKEQHAALPTPSSDRPLTTFKSDTHDFLVWGTQQQQVALPASVMELSSEQPQLDEAMQEAEDRRDL